MIDIIHRAGIKAPISKVDAALSTIEGVAGWWTNIKHKSIVYWSEGYFLLQVNSLEEALAIARQYPGLPYGAKMKVRPVAGECPLVEVRVLGEKNQST